MPEWHVRLRRGAINRTRTFILAVVATIAASASVHAQSQDPIPPRLSVSKALYFQQNPEAWSQFLAQLPRRPTEQPQATAQPVSPAFGGTWTAVTKAPVSGLSNPLLLTDGTVIVHVMCSQSWYRLTPDINGNYATGRWWQIASLPSGYGPLYFASAVLPDGRVIMEGGEYNLNCSSVWTNLGAIYDPVANTWTSVSPPSGNGWSHIGDAASIVLPNGTFMLSSCCAYPSVDALFNAATSTYTSTGAPPTYQNEQGYALLPTGNVLTIDI